MDRNILNKYIAGDASQAEKESVQLWLEADSANRKELMSLRTLYDITLGHLPEENGKMVNLKKNRRKLLTDLIKIAAAVLVTFGCTYYFLAKDYQPEEEVAMQTLHIPAGQRAELTLTDGTKVWLNALTTLTFPNKFTLNNREVYLDGEAYFNVEHDAEKPFTVKTDKYLVNVLGTEFNITAYMKRNLFETSLLNGSVEVVSRMDNQKIILDPGERAYLKDNKLVVSAIRNYDHFLWTKGILSFDHERMDDIFDKLQLYYDVEIRNDNQKINEMRYTGKFRTRDGIEHVLNVLKIATGLKYTKDNDLNIIYIK